MEKVRCKRQDFGTEKKKRNKLLESKNWQREAKLVARLAAKIGWQAIVAKTWRFLWSVFEAITFNLLSEIRWNAVVFLGRFVEPKSFATSDELLLPVICFTHFFGLRCLPFTVFYRTCRSYLFRWAYITNFLRTRLLKFPIASAASALTKAKQQSSFDVKKIMQSL